MSRTITIIIAIVALLGIGSFFVLRQQQAEQEPEFEILREATASQGQISSTVNAVGSIEPEALVTLTFGATGTIQNVSVTRGQTVNEGDVLAFVDTAELQLAVQQAEDALRIQELNLQQRLNSAPSPATLASAQSDIDSAVAGVAAAEANLASAEASVLQSQAQKSQLLTGPTPGQIANAEAQIASAQATQDSAQRAYDQTLECFEFTGPDGGRNETCPGLGAPEEQARVQLNNANVALAAAEAQLADLRLGATFADIQSADAAIAIAEANVLASAANVSSAEAALSRAQAAYDRQLEPPTTDEIAILEAQITSAQTNLALAQLRLDQSIIVAPISGTVAAVNINAGEQASPGSPAITIVDEGAFHITVNVDEIDIDQVALGQAVDISIDALPDEDVVGEIAEIAPTSASAGGVVTYLVTINIEKSDVFTLRPGMSANASIVVEEIENVLVVPNWAIRLDRETGDALVNVQRSAELIEEVVVVTGLRNEQFSEIQSGLSEGDVVVVTDQREAFTFFGGGGQ
ncbi:MAG: efflux RND transporter periplasmic adaptor subunit [Chloroflexota bacterium]